MVITYHGGECFKVSQGDLTLAFNPPAKDSKYKISKFGADIALSSLAHPDFAGIETASLGERAPFAIEGPGEYDVQGVSVHGWGSAADYEGLHRNTLYSVLFENMTLCFLGALSSGDLPQEAKAGLDDIDILFVPVGGSSAASGQGGVLGYAAAYKLAVGLEPKVVVPMHYDASSLKSFLKEAGAEAAKPVDRLTARKKDLDGKEAEIVVLAES